MRFGGNSCGLHHEESVTQTWSKLSQIVCFMMLITSGKLINMIRNKNAGNPVIRSQNKDFKILTLCKIQFQTTKFKSMAFPPQGVLGHNSWCFGKMRLQALQWKKNGIKWMLELKVTWSQSWRKRVDFPYLEIFQILLYKWPIIFCIQTWLST